MSRFLAPIIKEIGPGRLRDLTPGKIRALAKRMYPNLKPQSLNTLVLCPVSAVLNHAHQFGLCNPIRIKHFKAEGARIQQTIDREWLYAFMRAAPPHLAAFALFCFTTGSRPQEACNLRPEHFDLDKGIAIGGITKNGKHRVYYLTPEMVSMLRVLPPRRISKGPHTGEHRVFGFTDARSIRREWIKVCEAAGLEYRTRYEAGRHSFFTEVIVRHGVDVVTAAKLGNVSPQIALQRYAHADAPEKAAMKVFGTKSAQRKRRKLKVVGES